MFDGSGGSNPHIHTSPETRALEFGVLQRRGASPHTKTIRPNGFCMILSYTIHVMYLSWYVSVQRGTGTPEILSEEWTYQLWFCICICIFIYSYRETYFYICKYIYIYLDLHTYIHRYSWMILDSKSSFLGECAGEFLEVGEGYPRAVPGREHGTTAVRIPRCSSRQKQSETFCTALKLT